MDDLKRLKEMAGLTEGKPELVLWQNEIQQNRQQIHKLMNRNNELANDIARHERDLGITSSDYGTGDYDPIIQRDGGTH